MNKKYKVWYTKPDCGAMIAHAENKEEAAKKIKDYLADPRVDITGVEEMKEGGK